MRLKSETENTEKVSKAGCEQRFVSGFVIRLVWVYLHGLAAVRFGSFEITTLAFASASE